MTSKWLIEYSEIFSSEGCKNIGKTNESATKEKKINVEEDSEKDDVVEKKYKIFDIALENLIRRDNLMSILVSGQPGVGKTYQILKKISTSLVNGKILKEDCDYIHISGVTTPKGLYETLYNYRDGKILIFDDCDGIITDDKSISILKAALDNTKNRKISWIKNTKKEEENIESFIFSSKIIIITNIIKDKINESLRSRAMYFDLFLTNQQILNRARKLKDELMPDMNDETREKVFNAIVKYKDYINCLSFRTFLRANSLINNDTKQDEIEDITRYYL